MHLLRDLRVIVGRWRDDAYEPRRDEWQPGWDRSLIGGFVMLRRTWCDLLAACLGMEIR